MIIIGEKINGAVPATGEAIRNRNADYIRGLAKKQEEAGANYLDVCAGSSPELEYDDLCWLLDEAQSASDLPICLDSPDPHMLIRAIDRVDHPGILNSISGEHDKCDLLLPLVAERGDWSVMALCSDNDGVAVTAESKFAIAERMMARIEEFGIEQSRVFIDLSVLAASAVEGAGAEFLRCIPLVKEKWPAVKVTAAVSNVSYGSPVRGLLNHTFLALALEKGLDAAIIDPTNRDMIGALYATDLLMGRDARSRRYNKAFRQGRIGKPRT